jgi:hypothetical protein
MPSDDFITDLKKALIGAIGAFDAWFFTNAPYPFICTGWGITNLPSLSTQKTTRIDVFPPSEKRSKQFDLGGWGRIVCNLHTEELVEKLASPALPGGASFSRGSQSSLGQSISEARG